MDKKQQRKQSMKKCLLFPLLIAASSSFSQPFASMESGNRLGINIGYNYNNIIFKGGGMFPYTRVNTNSNVTYFQVGIKTAFITPMIGISHYHVTRLKNCDVEDVSKTSFIASIELGKNLETAWGGSYKPYIFCSHSVDLFYGAGLRIFITKK